MNDEQIREAFRVKVGKLNMLAFSPKTSKDMPNGITYVSPLVKSPSELKQKLIRFVQTRFGSLLLLMAFALLLAWGQTNVTTPFKYLLFRNLAIAYFINWWAFNYRSY